jgi:hypothetical protein
MQSSFKCVSERDVLKVLFSYGGRKYVDSLVKSLGAGPNGRAV